VLDAGTPAELVTRHAGGAVVDFAGPAHALPELRALTGVHDASYDAGRVTVRGDRQSIAHVGSWLVARGPVPDDLRVDVPNLESALLALLARTSDSVSQTPAAPSTHERIGALR
jgi:ABC-2 type transport system ATP-binding protein